jgi:predicted  nucleic acid-binding Zn-ribbon protein
MVWPFTTINNLKDEIIDLDSELAYMDEEVMLKDAQIAALNTEILELKADLREARRQSDAFESIAREACHEVEVKPKRKKVAA